jgi:peptidoglycan/xylan/chitin deacetylase (PgdA/CDA1 family)
MYSILVYHTIDNAEGQPLCPERISPERFEEQLHWLSRRRRVVRLNETLAKNRGQHSVSVTFDDGYRDNLTIALPLLEKYSIPMTMFMAAGFIDRDGYLSKHELRELSRHPLVTVGSHGFEHLNFNALTADEARFELTESRRVLEEIIGKRVTLMAWPYGECSAELEQLSAECGYDASWSVWKGTNSQHSRWRVPLGAHDNLMRFIAKASGVYALTEAKLHRFKERRRVHRLAGVVRHEKVRSNAGLSAEAK